MKIKFYLHTAWGNHFKQLVLLPAVCITTNKFQRTQFSVLSISFLAWDFGISFYKEL
jgi:hypothetical protein